MKLVIVQRDHTAVPTRGLYRVPDGMRVYAGDYVVFGGGCFCIGLALSDSFEAKDKDLKVILDAFSTSEADVPEITGRLVRMD